MFIKNLCEDLFSSFVREGVYEGYMKSSLMYKVNITEN